MGIKDKNENESRGRPLRDREAAAFLGVSEATLPTWRCRGKGPRYVRLGRAVRYLECDLAAYLEAHAVDPEAE
jgi:predicted DNA-binding transcriptional regulator AlpA